MTDIRPSKPKIFTIWPFTESFLVPSFRPNGGNLQLPRGCPGGVIPSRLLDSIPYNREGQDPPGQDPYRAVYKLQRAVGTIFPTVQRESDGDRR